jgi:ubiquitin-conjugating enzyme E2 J1
MAVKYNYNNPSVKRIMQEVREMEREKTSQYYAAPLEDDLFEWHFTIRGPRDTPFEGGVYHGRILLPPEYPFKPPNIILLTPNGRFEIGQKICLSISAHHPEHWQPSWSIRTVLVALIGFMPTKGGGAIAALDYSAEERRELARKSLSWTCERCGSKNLQALPCEDPNEDTKKQQAQLPAELSPLSNAAPELNKELTESKVQVHIEHKDPGKEEATPPSEQKPSTMESPSPSPLRESPPSNSLSETASSQASVATAVQQAQNVVQPSDRDKSLNLFIFAVLMILLALLVRKMTNS